LDLARADVEPAANDQILLPTGYEQIAVLIDMTDVAGFEPGACRRRRLASVVVQITDSGVRGLNEDRAVPAGDRLTVFITNLDRSDRKRAPDRAGFAAGRAEVGRNEQKLGETVALHHFEPVFRLELSPDLGRERRGRTQDAHAPAAAMFDAERAA